MWATNCGKTFMLDPLRVIFKSFLSPVTCSYAWLGVEDKEIIFLNDFRYSPVIIPWSDLLLLLEGHFVHFAAPKTSYNEDILFEKDTLIFPLGSTNNFRKEWCAWWSRDGNDERAMANVYLSLENTCWQTKGCSTPWALLCQPFVVIG